MSAGLTSRDRCVLCDNAGLTPLVTLPAVPIFQGCVPFDPEPDECVPMTWSACEACGAAQIAALPPLERIYQAGHATGLGQAWARHHAAFSAFLLEHAKGAIVDVGGGSGSLAAAYRRAGGRARWTILEPNALRSPDLPGDVEVVDGFLDGASLKGLAATSVVMCHMLEHVVAPRAALAALTTSLPPDGRIVLAWPDLELWVRNGLAGALNFEHGIYVPVPQLVALFAEFGWVLQSERIWPENHTVFLAFARGHTGRPVAAPVASAAPVVASYFERFRTCAAAINRRLERHDGELFLMPASIYVQILLASGLDEHRFSALLDNAPIKQSRRLYGTALRVAVPAEILRSAKRPLVVLNGGAHDPEISASLRGLRPDVSILCKREVAC